MKFLDLHDQIAFLYTPQFHILFCQQKIHIKAVNYGLLKKYPVLADLTQLKYETHRKGGAWDRVYRNGMGNRSVIPCELIRTCG